MRSARKFENHCHALALDFVWYNFCRLHKAHRMSPAMAAALTDKLMDVSDIVKLIDAQRMRVQPRSSMGDTTALSR
jgi:hypothetical protein